MRQRRPKPLGASHTVFLRSHDGGQIRFFRLNRLLSKYIFVVAVGPDRFAVGENQCSTKRSATLIAITVVRRNADRQDHLAPATAQLSTVRHFLRGLDVK